MKKIIALLLAVIMVMGLATVVSADPTEGEGTTTPTTDPNYTDNNVGTSTTIKSVDLKKFYRITGAQNVNAEEAKEVYPHEKLSFVATPDASNPTTENITIADWTVNGPNGTMSVTLPAYTEVGKYVYTVKEVLATGETAAQGAVYATDEITVTALVTYNAEHKLVATLYLTQTTAGGTTATSKYEVNDTEVVKVDTFVNTYDVGHMTVTKTVEGNLGSRDEEFKMTVTFKAENQVKSDITIKDGSNDTTYISATDIEKTWTAKTEGEDTWYEASVDIFVKHGETVNFYNIPAGVTYTVEEAEEHLLAAGATVDPNGSDREDYTVDYNGTDEGTIASNSTSAVTVKNTKNTQVDTGVNMDVVPFVVMMVIAVLGVVAITAKKRVQE